MLLLRGEYDDGARDNAFASGGCNADVEDNAFASTKYGTDVEQNVFALVKCGADEDNNITPFLGKNMILMKITPLLWEKCDIDAENDAFASAKCDTDVDHNVFASAKCGADEDNTFDSAKM
ncbi:hypothetical protein HAX54_011029 [Datura stramonium]|uniref:Uncharacterized protein n=1 Tax=Datura stramonium TaxID=4076 RepID=A0ABS8TIT3_DATST|nr:hypothetical protein [Datura stramonium]